MLVGLPYLVGYLMVAYARFAVTRAGFISVLLLGRLLTGVGLGWSTLAVSVSLIRSPRDSIGKTIRTRNGGFVT